MVDGADQRHRGHRSRCPPLRRAVADRLPLQDALGASAAGLAVCATARENGVTDPDAWVPLLGTVILDRRLTVVDLPDHAAAEAELTEAADDPSEPPSAMHKMGDGGQRAVRTLWRLARALLEVQGAFDERPRGGWLPRIVGKVPVVGVAAGWLDERGGIKRATRGDPGDPRPALTCGGQVRRVASGCPVDRGNVQGVLRRRPRGALTRGRAGVRRRTS